MQFVGKESSQIDLALGGEMDFVVTDLESVTIDEFRGSLLSFAHEIREGKLILRLSGA
jgi:hypothetical protein